MSVPVLGDGGGAGGALLSRFTAAAERHGAILVAGALALGWAGGMVLLAAVAPSFHGSERARYRSGGAANLIRGVAAAVALAAWVAVLGAGVILRRLRRSLSAANNALTQALGVALQNASDKRWFVAAAIGVGVLLQATAISTPVDEYDEGLILTGADRVAHGMLPYRDFWTVYGPGQFHWLAFVFNFVSDSLLVSRLVDLVPRGVLLLLAYRLALAISASRRWASFSLLAAVIWTSNFKFFSYPAITALCLALLSVLLVVASRGHAMRFIAGLAAGLTALFRHDIGAYVMAASLGAGAAVVLLDGEGRRARSALADAGALVAGFSLVLLPAAAVFIQEAGLRQLCFSLIEYPATIFPSVRSLPYPFAAAFLFPFVPPVLTFAHILRTRRTDMAPIVVAMFTMMMFLQARVRSDHIHLYGFYFCALLLLHPAFCAISEFIRGAEKRLGILALIVLAVSFVDPLEMPRRVSLYRRSEALRHTFHHGVPRARGVLMRVDQAETIRFVRNITADDEPIFVGNTSHERLRSNDASFYFLADRRPATYFHELDPGTLRMPQTQRRIIAELERSATRVAVIVDRKPSNEPNASSLPSGVTLLDDHLRASYREVFHSGMYRVLQRPTLLSLASQRRPE